MEQYNPKATHQLLLIICTLHRDVAAKHRIGDATTWKLFIDQLYLLLRDTKDVPPQARLLMWQDSFGIRATQCGTKVPYTPDEMLTGPPDWWTTR